MTPLDDAIELLIGHVSRWIIDHLSQEAGGPDPIGQAPTSAGEFFGG